MQSSHILNLNLNLTLTLILKVERKQLEAAERQEKERLERLEREIAAEHMSSHNKELTLQVRLGLRL